MGFRVAWTMFTRVTLLGEWLDWRNQAEYSPRSRSRRKHSPISRLRVWDHRCRQRCFQRSRLTRVCDRLGRMWRLSGQFSNRHCWSVLNLRARICSTSQTLSPETNLALKPNTVFLKHQLACPAQLSTPRREAGRVGVRTVLQCGSKAIRRQSFFFYLKYYNKMRKLQNSCNTFNRFFVGDL